MNALFSTVELILDRLSTKQLVNADALTHPHAHLVNSGTSPLVNVDVHNSIVELVLDKSLIQLIANASALITLRADRIESETLSLVSVFVH